MPRRSGRCSSSTSTTPAAIPSSRTRCTRRTRVAELTVTYDKGPENYGVSVLEIRDGKIARESIYVTEGFEAPEWRAQWRAGPYFGPRRPAAAVSRGLGMR
jgi:hypothetical protein